MKKSLRSITTAMMLAIAVVSVPLSASADENIPASIAENETSLVSIEDISAIDNAPIIGEMQVNSYYENLNKQKESAASVAATVAAKESNRIVGILQVPQEKSYWCGYAAMKSLLDYEGVVLSQREIANKTWTPNDACPWYKANGNSRDQFPVPNVLQELTGFYYAPYPFGGAGATNLTASMITPKIVSTINNGHGLLACGESYRTYDKEGSRLPGYPAWSVTHWVAIDGYRAYGDEVWIVDPVANSGVVSWSDDINKYYSISADRLASFATMRGIIW